MSYSFSVRGADKTDAIERVRAELVKVVESQPAHAVDELYVNDAVDNFVDILADDPAQDVAVMVSGSVNTADAGIYSAQVSVNAYLTPKTPAA